MLCVEILSPRKKKKCHEDMENLRVPEQGAIPVSVEINRCGDDEDVFLDNSRHGTRNNANGLFTTFSTHKQPATAAADTSYIQYSLPPPRKKSAWVEDTCDDDDMSVLMSNHDDDISLLASHDPNPRDLTDTHFITSEELRGPDRPEIQNEIREGKLCEAPTFQASLALKDLNEKLRGPSKGKGGGYRAPDLDPFV
ncbi:hypothetical protein FPV67DRAFT_1679826 [Lyophyllum atratum]|nr:hypothetical protein FPV67DRAFT_1679826 [Lyophyllum atratum]